MAATKLSAEKLAELKEAFMLFDYMKTGRIYSADIGAVIRSVGLRPTQAEIRRIEKDINTKGDGTVDLSTLVSYISQEVTTIPNQKVEDLSDMFDLYDPQRTGYVTQQEMIHLLTSIGEKLTEEEARDLLRMTGAVEKDRVNYQRMYNTLIQMTESLGTTSSFTKSVLNP